jgi:membrane protein EpsK
MDQSKDTLSPVYHIRNIASNLAFVGFNLIISLWYTPFLIRGLGSVLFGFIPLANSVINFFGIITNSLNTASGRFITIELGKNNTERANQIFNTTLIGSILLISSTIPIALGLVVLLPNMFNVPTNYVKDVQFLFIGTICAFYLTTLRNNFLVATFAKNRFDLRNIVSLSARFGQIAIVVILFNFQNPGLLHISLGVMGAGALSLIGDYSLWKRLLPGLKVNLREFKKKLMKPVMGTSIWVLVYYIGSTLFVNTDMLVANRTLELSTAGMFGALLVIPKNLRIMANAVGSVWAPTFLTKFSKSDLAGMDKILLFTVKLIGFTIALPVGLIAGLARPFLNTWLGTEYTIMTWVLVVLICHLSVNLIATPFLNVQVTLMQPGS